MSLSSGALSEAIGPQRISGTLKTSVGRALEFHLRNRLAVSIRTVTIDDEAGQRMQSNLRLWFADSAIDYQTCQLASDDLIVERGAKLGGERVSHTLWTRTGVYAVLALDGSTDDLATVDALVRDLPTVEEIVRDLRSWISSEVHYAAKVVFFCPYTNEPPRVWYGTSGAEAWLIGGIEQLEEWLAAQPGPRVDRQVLAWLREKQKPREVKRGPSITAPGGIRRG